MAIQQYMRKNEVVFVGDGLYPLSNVIITLNDTTDITGFSQVANELVVESNTAASLFLIGAGITNNTTNAYARVIGTSNNTIFLNQNFITVDIDAYGATPLPDGTSNSYFLYGQSVCQTTVEKVTAQNAEGGLICITSVAVPGMLGYAKNWNSFLKVYGATAQVSTKSSSKINLLNTILVSNDYRLSHPYTFDEVFPPDWTKSFKVVFPSTGYYQFVYSVDDQMQVWLDGLEILPFPSGRWDRESYLYREVSGGVHTLKVRSVNTGGPFGTALVIRGPGTYSADVFQHGTWNASTASWPNGVRYSGDPLVIFDLRFPPQTVVAYNVVKTFVGKVEYYSRDEKVLVIKPEIGTFNDIPNTEESTIRLIDSNGISTTKLANTISIKSGNLFPAESNVTQIKLESVTSRFKGKFTANTAKILSYNNRSGLVIDIDRGGTSGTNPTPNISLQSGIPYSTYVGKRFNVRLRTGEWYYSTISSVIGGTTTAANLIIKTATTYTSCYDSTKTRTLNDTLKLMDSTCYYSIGDLKVNDYGVVSGMIILPENPEQALLAGKGKITLTDNLIKIDAKSRAEAIYTTGTDSIITQPTTTDLRTTIGGNIAERYKGWDSRGFDPVAQTFFIPGKKPAMYGETEALDGIWASSVDLWFKSKSDSATKHPITVRIVEVENGVPTNVILASVTVKWDKIKITDNPYGTTVKTGILPSGSTTHTNFKFPDPVYLSPDTTYALTVYSNDNTYEVWCAKWDEVVVGTATTTKTGNTSVTTGGITATNFTGDGRIPSKEPYIGQFFESQNATSWSAVPFKDLMFRINKCVFSTSNTGAAIFNVTATSVPGSEDIPIDAMYFRALGVSPQNTNIKWNLRSWNPLIGFKPNIEIVPNQYLDFGADVEASTRSSNRRRVFRPSYQSTFLLEALFETSNPDISPMVYTDSISVKTFEHDINDGPILTKDVVLLTPGRHNDAANVVVTISYPDDNSIPRSRAYAKVEFGGSISNTDITVVSAGSHSNIANIRLAFSEPNMANTQGGMTANGYVRSLPITSSSIVVDNPGSGYINTAPTITVTEDNCAANAVLKVFQNVEHLIVTSPSGGYWKTPTITITETGSTSNATAVIKGETDASGGNALARYISKTVNLKLAADDLIVYLDCVRPLGSHVNVYYKVKSSIDLESFESKKWQLMNKVSDIYSPDKKTFVQLQYKPTYDENNALSYLQDGVKYPLGNKFDQFAIKITMLTSDPTITPIVANMTVLALPAG